MIRIEKIENKNVWNSYLEQFNDANIYQTWSYAEIVQSERKIDHTAFFENDELVGMSLVRIREIPFINRGVAYIFKGPLWRKCTNKNSIDIFYKILNSLRDEYVVKKNYFLRIKPNIYTDQVSALNLPEKLTFSLKQTEKIYNTLVLHLDKDLDIIRKEFKQKWRNGLNQAEKNNIEVISGNTNELYEIFIDLYKQMINRKKFKEFVDIYKKGKMNEAVDEKFKLMIFIALKDKIPVSALVGTAMGDTGIYLLGATNESGMRIKSSYLLQWEMIKWLKAKGIKRYDLGGINKINNPGVYRFKSGITDNEVQDFGFVEASNGRFIKNLFNLINIIRARIIILTQFFVNFECL